jgi:hypothetical protein
MDPLFLFVSIFWGAVGLGFFIYGKKRQRPVHLVGGAVLMLLAYFARTSLSQSLAGIAVVGCIYLLSKRM